MVKRILFAGVLALVCLGFALQLVPSAQADEAAPPTLGESDCAKCHDAEPQVIAEKGAAHKTEIGCQACHENHRPRVANNIPECGNCHGGASHYELPECGTCHNPHAPLDITLEGELTGVCLTCHTQQGQEIATNPSAHGEVSCNFCHAEKHGVIPECVQCHDPHSQQMTQADCGTCHQAHQPLLLTYGSQTPSTQCAACHETAYGLLTASETRHATVTCVTCHADQHKAIAACSDCHGTPHAPGMHQKFPNCGDCHGIAHDLNNWKEQKEGTAK